jgi:hypothetical protein
MSVCVSSVCIVLCSGIVTGGSSVQGLLPTNIHSSRLILMGNCPKALIQKVEVEEETIIKRHRDLASGFLKSYACVCLRALNPLMSSVPPVSI